MSTRTLSQVIASIPTSDGAGVKLRRSIGARKSLRVDPFLMLDEFGTDNPDDYIAGFPPHPHRGFETVTYMLDGSMRHEDHMGNVGDLGAGGVQWMTAGRGIIHSEMPLQREGRMRGFQLWINLPAAEKMKPASYRDIPAGYIPVIKIDGGSVKVIAGAFDPSSVDPSSVDPSSVDPGSVDPGSVDPGSVDPGSFDPSSFDPSSVDPSSVDPGSVDPGCVDPGSVDPGAFDPGSVDPGSVDPSSVDPSSVDAGSVDQGVDVTTGPISGLTTEPLFFDVHLDAGIVFEHALPANHNAFLYTYEGQVEVGPEGMTTKLPTQAAGVLSGGDSLRLKALTADTRIIVLAGKPIGEPIEQQGPFVMNTRAEIEQAFADYRNGTLATVAQKV